MPTAPIVGGRLKLSCLPSPPFVSIEGMYDNKDQNLDSINVPIQRKIVTTKMETHFCRIDDTCYQVPPS